VASQNRAAAAWAEGRFDRSVVTIRDQNGLSVLERDEYMRPGTDMQSLGALKPAFKDMGEAMPGFDKVAMMKYPHLERINHIHHAGNSSGIVDGAAAILIGNREFGEAHGLKPRARIRATAKIGTDPTIMLTGPVPVTEKILREAGLVAGEKRGYWTHYVVRKETLMQIIGELENMVRDAECPARQCRRFHESQRRLLAKEVKSMCCGPCCEQPIQLKGKAEECTPEQIRGCHGDVDNHPCGEKKKKGGQTKRMKP